MATQLKTTESPWQALSADEKLERRLEAWLSPPGVRFASPEAEAGYKARVTRIIDAPQFAQTLADSTHQATFHDTRKLRGVNPVRRVGRSIRNG